MWSGVGLEPDVPHSNIFNVLTEAKLFAGKFSKPLKQFFLLKLLYRYSFIKHIFVYQIVFSPDCKMYQNAPVSTL